jgi:hypothetical protein
MNARPNFDRIDQLGQRLADQAFRTLTRKFHRCTDSSVFPPQARGQRV